MLSKLPSKENLKECVPVGTPGFVVAWTSITAGVIADGSVANNVVVGSVVDVTVVFVSVRITAKHAITELRNVMTAFNIIL